MPQVTITLSDTPAGGVAIHSSFAPAVGKACSPAQAAALEIINRTNKQWGVVQPATVALNKTPLVGEVDIDAIHRTRDRVVRATVKEVAP